MGKWELSKMKHQIQGDYDHHRDLYPQKGEEVQGLKHKMCQRGSEINILPDNLLAQKPVGFPAGYTRSV